MTVTRDSFNTAIGQLDRSLSVMMEWGRAAERGELDSADLQTLKHHAEDMIGAANAILGRVSRKVEGT